VLEDIRTPCAADCPQARGVRSSGVFPRIAIIAAVSGALGCVADPVEWEAPAYLTNTPSTASETTEAVPAALCSVVSAALGDFHYRAGWSRAGELLVMKSGDRGETWESPVVADGREKPADVCYRPAPALFADSLNGYLHVVYFAEPRGAPGVYYVHSMYPEQLAQVGAGMFEQPLPIVFGTRVARTAVASRGDTVVVAHEDPNAQRGGIGVAISRTGGHSFDRRLVASSGPAQAPRVELRAGEVRLFWQDGGEPQRWMTRRGVFR
jgi:hypothetical protein